jgi:juvenile hormone-III synthase
MDKGKLYSRYNFAQRKLANGLISDFGHYFNWPSDQSETVPQILDVGTGSGDVLEDFILPVVPTTAKIVGSDISMEMIKFARANFESSSRSVKFCQADISVDYELLKKQLPETFDNITSFSCFHWIQNQRLFNEFVKKNASNFKTIF